jgi:membrane fusion protein (multidrug efflux system)
MRRTKIIKLLPGNSAGNRPSGVATGDIVHIRVDRDVKPDSITSRHVGWSGKNLFLLYWGRASDYIDKKEASKQLSFIPRRLRLLMVVVSASIVLSLGLRYYLHERAYESTNNAIIGVDATQITARVSGSVVSLRVKDNSHVEVGDLLAELDSADFEARRDNARAALQSAEARYRAAQAAVEQTRITADGAVNEAASGVGVARADLGIAHARLRAANDRHWQAQAAVKAAEAQVLAADTEVKRASGDARRYNILYGQGLVSQQDLERVNATAQSAVAKLASAKAQVEVAQAAAATAGGEVLQGEAQAKQARELVGQAKARSAGASSWSKQVEASWQQAVSLGESVEQARANLKEAELQLSYTKIRSPISGRVTHRSFYIGDNVKVDQELMTIVSDTVYVIANFKETQTGLFAPGQPAYIRIDKIPGRVFKGHVDSIQAGTASAFSLFPSQNSTTNFVKTVQFNPVRVLFDEPLDSVSHLLGPGLQVVLEVKVR